MSYSQLSSVFLIFTVFSFCTISAHADGFQEKLSNCVVTWGDTSITPWFTSRNKIATDYHNSFFRTKPEFEGQVAYHCNPSEINNPENKIDLSLIKIQINSNSPQSCNSRVNNCLTLQIEGTMHIKHLDDGSEFVKKVSPQYKESSSYDFLKETQNGNSIQLTFFYPLSTNFTSSANIQWKVNKILKLAPEYFNIPIDLAQHIRNQFEIQSPISPLVQDFKEYVQNQDKIDSEILNKIETLNTSLPTNKNEMNFLFAQHLLEDFEGRYKKIGLNLLKQISRQNQDSLYIKAQNLIGMHQAADPSTPKSELFQALHNAGDQADPQLLKNLCNEAIGETFGSEREWSFGSNFGNTFDQLCKEIKDLKTNQSR